MLKKITFFFSLFYVAQAVAQPLTGIKTIKTGGDYTTFSLAIASLNTNGVGAGGVTFNVDAGLTFAENTTPITTTGTMANPIVFQKFGAGANPQLQPSGTASANDFGFKLEGVDYITFDGIDVNVNGATIVEYGFWIANVSATNGSQNNTIKNCTVTLNKTIISSRGIISTVPNAPTNASGSNSFNKFHNVLVTNSYRGYDLSGNATYPDSATEIKSISGGTAGVNNIGNNTTAITYGIFLSSQIKYTISDQTISNVSTSSGGCYGIKVQGTGSYGSIFNNTVQSINASTSGAVYGVSLTTSNGTIQNVYNNIISNSSSGTGIACGIEGATGAATYNVYNNTIHSISTSGSTATNSAYGITNSGANVTLNVYKNNIYNIASNGASASVAAGLNVSGTTARIYNNVIFDIKNPNGISTTTAPSTRGITLNTATSNFYVYHNTVYLGYTATGASNSSTALFTNAAATVDLRNNIFVNNTNISTGTRAVAHQRAATTLTMFTNTTDDNLYYAGTPGTKNLIYYDGTNSEQTLFAYQNRMATREWHSVTELPAFINTTLGSQDLRLNATAPTQCEKGGRLITTPFSVADDFNSNTRSGTYVDMGAYEGTYVRNDLTGPYITYTTLPNTTLLTDRTIVATITDPSGVPTSGVGLPTLYWKKITGGIGGSYIAVQGTSLGSDTYSFSFGSPVSAGDSVYYFVAAQDAATTPNVFTQNAVNATGYTANPPAASTAPTNANGYKVVFPIASEIRVGTSGADYSSLTNALGVFQAIKDGVMTENVTIKILTDLTAETGTFDLAKWVEELGSDYTISIVPNDGVPFLISGSNGLNGLIRLNGAKNVTIDGSYNGSGNYLTFRNTDAGGFTPCVYLYNDASNNTIKNCTIEGNMSTGGSQVGTLMIASGTVTGNDNNSFLNNNIRNISTGSTVTNIAVYSIGTTTGINNSNNIFDGNQIFNFGGFGMRTTSGNENTTITNNTFYQSIANPASSSIGIDFGSNGNNIIEGNTFSDLKVSGASTTVTPLFIQSAGTTLVSKNKMYNYPTTAGSLYGIYYAGSSAAPVNIKAINNQITIDPTGTTNQNIYGIDDQSFQNNTLNAYNNSIYIGGSSNTATNNSFGYRRSTVSSGGSTNIIRNNIFANNRTNPTPGATGANFAISDTKDGLGTFIASNNLYVGTGLTAIPDNIFQRGNGTPVAENFADWKTAKRDLSSYAFKASDISITSLFNNFTNGDLTINNGSDISWLVNGKGLALATVADDVNQTNIRSTTITTGATDIGADEFTTSTLPPPFTATGAHTLGGTENFSYGSRTLATITWGNTGTLPTLGTLKHYTGVWPNDPTNNGTTSNARFLNEWFEVEATGGAGYTYDITFNYDSCMLGTIQSETTMQGFKKQIGVAGTWAITGGTNINTLNKLMSLSGLASFSEFTASDLLAPLPLQLVQFAAINKKPSIELKWQVVDENSNTIYELYRSVDGVNFEKINTISANNILTNNHNYLHNDNNVFNNFNNAKAFYYKLKIIENNRGSYSQVVVVKNSNAINWIQAIYPNPFKNSINATVQMDKKEQLIVNIYNSNGALIKSSTFNLDKGIHSVNIALQNLAKGVYTVEYKTSKNKFVENLIKE